ncbi:MAG: hypothetical protein A3G32_04380 [Deltaproteobacteria bacterium RIFCSPLOWO2_12_FULL_40_28]|nr:MAG: hypothetical protein A3C45_08490 [Deltaproteobacteria bacterium RIFCSPHIGHO2_02_FULL_40_28]OGQ19608.1 MAG: hypothetical protein A3E27_07685 [Deltaproteobacteria bacterium RIFCSPHIGHO2_12_FULL_40_32]OGQ40885.1 MAG: hypothetical protein A3I69_03100 [Deltaproteobacteria bacterium RIFCSPLOWO2_02_FULL_40_36]OGQ54000.1 MAG: hypothetical protein A3G32_04380 [Deltaproteobacteria bacterium RIFCSPLOWO2_12_FULL_40_28]
MFPSEKKSMMAFLAYIIVATLPFPIYSFEFPGGIGMTPNNLLAIFFAPFIVLNFVKNRSIPNFTIIAWLHGLFICISFVGVLTAMVDEWVAFRGTLAYVIEYFIVYLVVFTCLKSREEIETALKVLIVVTIINSLMGWIELFGFMLFGKMLMPPFASYFKELSYKNFGYGTGGLGIPGFVRMFGFLGPGADDLGSFTMFGLGAAMYFKEVTGKFFYKFTYWFFILTIIGGMSRNAFAGLLLMFLVYHVLKLDGKYAYRQLFLKIMAFTSMISLVVLIFYFAKDATFFQDTSVHLSSTKEVQSYALLVERLNPFVSKSFSKSKDYFTTHFDLALKYGFYNLGFGLGNQNFDEYIFDNYPIKYGSHSNFIQTLGDEGIWGLLVQLVIIILIMRFCILASFINRDGKKDLLPVVFVASFMGIMATGLIRTYYYNPYTFVLQAMIMVLYLQKIKEKNLLK